MIIQVAEAGNSGAKLGVSTKAQLYRDGGVIAAVGDVTKAQTYFEAAINIEPNNIDGFLGGAAIYKNEGKTELAFETLSRAQCLAEGEGKRISEATVNGDIGLLLLTMGRLEDAERNIIRALNIMASFRDTEHVAFYTCIVGIIKRRMCRSNEAEMIFNKVLNMEIGAQEVKAMAAAGLRDIYFESQQLSEAKAILEKSLLIDIKEGNLGGVLHEQFKLGGIEFLRGNGAGACNKWRHAKRAAIIGRDGSKINILSRLLDNNGCKNWLPLLR